MNEKDIKSEVQERYAQIARQASCGCSSDCCPSGSSPVTTLVDYGGLDAGIVEGANLGLGCGIPTQYAGICPGDTVLDLGSGAGVDVFLAAKLVGPQGRVIGVDMTPEMIERAKENAAKGSYHNVEFRLGDIEDLPVDSDSVDVVISNCVINLAPDKRRVLAEIYRVLHSGGRFSISDIVSYGQVPDEIRRSVELWAGCIAGAMDRDAYLQLMGEIGFTNVRINQQVEYDYFKGKGYGFVSVTVEGAKP